MGASWDEGAEGDFIGETAVPGLLAAYDWVTQRQIAKIHASLIRDRFILCFSSNSRKLRMLLIGEQDSDEHPRHFR